MYEKSVKVMVNKRAYIKPVLESETFVPQYYCKICANDGIHREYLFECNAGNKGDSYNVFFNDGTPYASSNDYDEWYAPFSGYHPCNETHKASTDSEFIRGYMYQQNRRGNNTGSKIDVIIWTNNRSNVHCTTNLDMNEWDTSKS